MMRQFMQKAWTLINTVDHLVYEKQLSQINDNVRKPLRQLSTDWRINVKMTDSVTEGKYALCRKALTSLDVWARETLENNSSVAQNRQIMSVINNSVRKRLKIRI